MNAGGRRGGSTSLTQQGGRGEYSTLAVQFMCRIGGQQAHRNGSLHARHRVHVLKLLAGASIHYQFISLLAAVHDCRLFL